MTNIIKYTVFNGYFNSYWPLERFICATQTVVVSKRFFIAASPLIGYVDRANPPLSGQLLRWCSVECSGD